MNEPSLATPGDLEGFRRRFRLLVLPTFHPAYAVRIDQGTAETRVTITRLDGSGGYDPGAIDQQEQFSLDPEGMAALDREVRTAGIAGLTPDAERSLQICLDGVRFVFEFADEDGSRMATRHQCELTPELTEFVLFIDGLRHRVGSDLAHYGVR